MASINRFSPKGLQVLFDVLEAGAGTLEGCTVKAMLLDTTTSLATDFATAATLDDLTTIGQYAGSGYKTPTNVQINVDGSGRVYLDFDNVTWAGLAASGTAEHFVVIAELTAADADRYILAALDVDEQPDGTDYVVQIPLNGIAVFDTA